MSRLRAFKKNGGKVYEEFTKRRKQQIKEETYKIQRRKMKKKVINKTAKEVISNIPMLTDGRTTGIGKLLRTLKGA